MRVLVTIIGAVFLVAITTVLGALLLPACGVLQSVAPTWIDWCPVNAQDKAETRLAALSERTSELENLILQRERELALMQCVRKPPKVAQVEEPVEVPEVAEPPEIDREAWAERDISTLDGCWNLDSRFSTTNRQTGVSTRYTTWRMCFNAQGVGREEMLAENGGKCSGPVQGRFNADGSLSIEEPGNLQCSDGEFIYRLSSRCQLQGDGTAACVVTQPEAGRSATVTFRRATGNE